MFGHWRRRALAAEAALTTAQETIDGIQLRLEDRAALVSIATTGRTKRLMFVRNGELTTINVYATMDADWNEIERKLLR
jgi:hypothetical protein